MTATEKNEKIILIVVAALLVISISVLLVFRIQTPAPPDKTFTPPQFDAAAVSGTPVKTGEHYGLLNLSLANGNCTVAMDANPRLEGGKLQVFLTSSAQNTVWIRVVLYDQDQIIGESGLIRPGEYVEAVTLSREIAGGTQLKAKLLTFEPDTYYSMGTVTANLVVR